MKSIHSSLFLLLSFLLPVSMLSQKQGNIWYFGQNAGISFNTTPPTAQTNGALNSREGCTSMATATGDLLFYTDGVTVWNRFHGIMANGSGLAGHQSSKQGAIIVPWPDQANLYYIFTADALENASAGGYNYSLVDMNGNGGTGQVIQKNTLLYAPSTERLTVARHSNGKDWWVLTKPYGNNQFYCYLITNTGLQTTPVVSTAGQVLVDHPDWGLESGMIGFLKVSPNGRKLVMSVEVGVEEGQEFRTEVFDFNPSTGVVSAGVTIDGDSWAAEFSPDSRYLYLADAGGTIEQFDLTGYTDAETLKATRVQVSPDGKPVFGMQLGPDGKIYISRIFTGYLSCINTPNTKGAGCGFQENAVDLGGRKTNLTLPNIICPLLWNGNVLPVRWDFFKGTTAGKENILQWKTLQEQNAKSFTMERSSNGNDWLVIGTVAARNSPHGWTYSFKDNAPFIGKNFYRLQQTDLDGKSYYSKIISLNNSENDAEKVHIFPVIQNGQLVGINTALTNSGESYEMEVYNAAGLLFKKVSLKENFNFTPITGASKGIYFIRITSKSGVMGLERISF
ncbi:MAG TPA: T9SS type A sorting domain-containing protein [Flavisolibacter sp.]|nr:T9SS type A sorting domain-containing protein [Flavisolibacter sp.]